MKQQQVYNLKEFAAKYQLKDIFGAYAAHIHTDVLNRSAQIIITFIRLML
jgi:AraC family transcriptional regulator, transcriptional activator of pobA